MSNEEYKKRRDEIAVFYEPGSQQQQQAIDQLVLDVIGQKDKEFSSNAMTENILINGARRGLIDAQRQIVRGDE